MFNRKLKKQLEELELRVWKLENPPKYKVGDKVNGYIVTEVEFVKGFITMFLEYENQYKYTLYNKKMKTTTKLIL